MNMDNDLLTTFWQLPDDAVQEWLEAHRDQLKRELVQACKAKAEEVGYGSDLEGGLRILDRALLMANALADPLAEALVWRGRANVLQLHERNAESLEASSRAVVLYEQYGTPFDVAVARTVEVNTLGGLERFDEAIQLGLWIRSHFDRHDFTLGQARLADGLAQVCTWAWRLSDALPEYHRARELYLQLQIRLDAAQVLHNMGVLAYRMDQLSEAQRYYSQAYPELEAASDVVMMVKTQFNLAQVCLRQGQYETALGHLAQARTDLVDLPDSPDRGYVNLFEAHVRWRLNQTTEAETLLREALELFDGLGRRLETAETLIILGHLLTTDSKLGKLEEALSYLSQAEAYLQKLDVPLFLAWVQLEQAEVRLRLAQTEEAARKADAARTVFVTANLQLRQAQADVLLADCCWRREPERARQLYQAALAIVDEADPLLAVRCWHGLGRLASAEGKYDEAEQAYEHAVALLDTVRRALSQHRQQAGFLEDKQALVDELLTVLHQQPDSEPRILTWVERFKAGVLAELLMAVSVKNANTNEDEFQALLAEREALRAKLDHWESQLRGEIGLSETFAKQRGSAIRSQEQYRAKRRTQLHRELDGLDEKLARLNRAAYEWHEGAAIEPDGVHELLDEETILLSYYTAEGGQLYALTATHTAGDLQVHALGTQLEEIATRWNRLAPLMMRPKKRLKSLQKRLADLWKRLIAPMAERLRTKTRLLILPYRDLFDIPFAGLYDAQNKRYLIEEWTIQIAPSATVLAKVERGTTEVVTTSRGEGGEGVPLLVGYPGEPYLQAVQSEIESLSKLLPQADVLFGEAATLQNVMEMLPNRPLIHIAGHIVYDHMSPLESGIPLAEARWLRASDLYLRYGYLNGSTVVLSGCESASGSAKGGDILGLTSAFLYAGAAGIVASLWPVDDEATAKLMATFTTTQIETAEALRHAQLDLLRDPATAHPYYWAAFVLNGASRVWGDRLG